MLSDVLVALIPRNTEDLLKLQFESAILYLALSALIHVVRGFKFDVLIVLKAAIAGGSFPPSVALTFVLFQPRILPLFPQPILKLYLSIAGLVFSVLTIHSLFTGPRKP